MEHREKDAVRYSLLGIPPSNELKNSWQLWLPAMGLCENKSVNSHSWIRDGIAGPIHLYGTVGYWWVLQERQSLSSVRSPLMNAPWCNGPNTWSQCWPRLNSVIQTTKQKGVTVRPGDKCKRKIKVDSVALECSVDAGRKWSKKILIETAGKRCQNQDISRVQMVAEGPP